jgi:MORN repeat
MDDATVATTKSAASAKGLPKCVCSWKNCRTYQKAYKSYGHPVLDGIVKVKFVKGDTASIPLKASVDRTLKVAKEKRQDWKPAKGEEVIRYNIARHHFTEAHIQRCCQDPKRYKWTSLFSEAEAKKYLFKLDPKETMSLGDAEVYYVQCPNVSKDHVKQQFLKMKAEMEEKEAQEHALRQQQQQSSALGRFLGSGGASTASAEEEPAAPKHQLPEHKDSMTISTTRSSELLSRKEEENNRLRKELEACKSQLAYLHEMVRQLQEDTCDSMSVYSRKSTRSRTSKKPKGSGASAYGMGGGAFPHEIELLDDEESEWDGGGDGEEDDGDWSEDDEDETIIDDNSSNFLGKGAPPATGAQHQNANAPPKNKMSRRSSLASRASIVSASQSVKSLPREIELAEDEENGSGSDDSSMADAFDDRSYVSRGSRVSRASHSIDNNDYSGANGAGAPAGKGKGASRKKGGAGRSGRKNKTAAAGYGGSSNGSDVETYEVKQQVIVDPYGEKGTYAGSLSKATGMPHGKGRLEYAAGRWYEGDWKHGRWTGRGRLSNGDGDLYEGELRNDHKHGKGTMRFADGRVFLGEYINGQMIEGRMTYQDGSTYDGSWVDGMRHGRGKCVFTDDSIYEGEFREGEFHGHGKMSWSDGGWYEGEWWNGEMQGHGREVRPDGSLRHEGAWSKGQPLRNRK